MLLTHDTYGNGEMWFWKPRGQKFKRDIENLDFTLKFKGKCRKQKNGHHQIFNPRTFAFASIHPPQWTKDSDTLIANIYALYQS